MLGAAGAIVLSTTVGAVLAEGDGGPHPKLTTSLATNRRKSSPPHRIAPSPSPSPTHAASGTRGDVHHEAAAPAEPVYYIHDGRKAIALTIDDGPSPEYTPQILRLLARYKVTASFSMIGRSVALYPEVAREVAHAGHMIVNHTWDHSDVATMTSVRVRNEIERATEAIHHATGREPRMFRAPYGAWSPTVLRYCEEHDLTALDWSVDPRDWAMPGTRSIISNIMRYTHTGSIILEHDGGGNRSETVAALKVVIPRLLDEGYHFRLP